MFSFFCLCVEFISHNFSTYENALNSVRQMYSLRNKTSTMMTSESKLCVTSADTSVGGQTTDQGVLALFFLSCIFYDVCLQTLQIFDTVN